MIKSICKECGGDIRDYRPRDYCSQKCYQKNSNVLFKKGQLNPSWKSDIISNEELRRLYLDEGRSVIYICRLKGCSESAIRKRLKYIEIKTRNFSEQYAIDKKYGRAHKFKGAKGKDNPAYIHGKKVGQKANRAKYLKIAKEHLEWICEECGAKPKDYFDLVVHHKDRNNKNNEVSNLQILCQGCHARLHQKETMNKRKIMVCIQCGKRFMGVFRGKFCSYKCQSLAYRTKNRDKINRMQIIYRLKRIPPKIQVCPQCLNKFETRDTRKEFCSEKCYIEWDRHHSRDEYKIKKRWEGILNANS